MSVSVKVNKYSATSGEREMTTHAKYSRVPCVGEWVLFKGKQYKVTWVLHMPIGEFQPVAEIDIRG